MPPDRSPASRTTTDVGPGAAPSQAAASPLMPAADDGQVDLAAHAGGRPGHRSARAPHHRGSSLIDGRAGEGQAPLGGPPGGLDVEVVEHLEVVGHEPLRAHQHAVGAAGVGQLAITSSTSGPATARACGPRTARPAPSRAHRAGPSTAQRRGRRAVGGDGGGGGRQLVGVGVAGQHPLGQRVGGEQHLGVSGAARRGRRAPGPPGRRATPARRATSRCRRRPRRRRRRRPPRPRPGRGTRRPTPASSAAPAPGRRSVEAAGGDQRGHGVLDEGRGVLVARARRAHRPGSAASRACGDAPPAGPRCGSASGEMPPMAS